MKSLLLFICGLLAAHLSVAQKDGKIYMSHSSLLAKVKLTMNGVEKKMAWCGGINTPQIATPDLNKDGKNDLVIFERYGQPIERGIKTFINTGAAGNPAFVYAPEYEYRFPQVSVYLKMQDYNCDGITDLFHYGVSGVGICDGFYTSDDKLEFTNCREIKYLYPGDPIPGGVGVGSSDIPSIVDVDKDGYLDVVTFSKFGSRIWMYKNLKVEKGYGCDTFAVKLKDECWGKVFQWSQREHWLHTTCDNSKHGPKLTKKTDGTNTLCLFDADGDGDYDVLTGNSQYDDIQFMRNNNLPQGDKIDSMTWQDTTWQSNGKKVHSLDYPNASWIDIDQDSDKDIVVSPLDIDAENYKVVHFYKNTGDDNNPNFVFQKDTLLVEDMLDLGDYSYPILYDFNKDGKKDLFVGSRGFYQPDGTFRSTIAYFKNTSAGGIVSFDLVDKNFLNIDTMSIEGAAPAIGDINNDGMDDLVLGRMDGTLTYYENIAASASVEPVWQLKQKQLFIAFGAIDVGAYATPLIYDIDKDGKKDILLGGMPGYISFYKNLGNPGLLQLQYVTNKLGDVQVMANLPGTYKYSAPFIGKMDNTNKEYLLVGTGFGAIYRYDGFQSGNVTSPYTLLDTQYSSLTIPGQMLSPIADDLDGDGKYDMLIGNNKGGLFYYKQMWNADVREQLNGTTQIELFPNPAGNILTMKADATIPAGAQLRILNSLGVTLKVINAESSSDVMTVDVSMLPSGIYLCTLKTGNILRYARFTKSI